MPRRSCSQKCVLVTPLKPSGGDTLSNKGRLGGVAVSWAQDTNGLSRRSEYTDRASKPIVLKEGGFGYYARHLDLIGELAFVLTKNGEIPFFECSSGLEFDQGDTVSGSAGLFGIQIGLSRTRSKTQTFPSGKCESCVPIMRLTKARLVEDRYYTRKKRLKARGTVRSVIREPGCQEFHSRDCVPKPDCPGCSEDTFMTPSLHETGIQQTSDGDQRTVSLAVESFESMHDTSAGLSADCYAWIDASFAAEEADTTSGVYVDAPWQDLTYLPPDLTSSSVLPAAMISAGLDIEPLGGIVLRPDESLPLVFLVPKTNSARLDSVYVPTSTGEPRQLTYDQSQVAQLKSAPISILSAIMAPVSGVDLSGGDLHILLKDVQSGLGTTLKVPLARVATH